MGICSVLGRVGRTQNYDDCAPALRAFADRSQYFVSRPLGKVQIENYEIRTIQGLGIQIVDKPDRTVPVRDHQDIRLDMVLHQCLAYQTHIGGVVLNQEN